MRYESTSDGSAASYFPKAPERFGRRGKSSKQLTFAVRMRTIQGIAQETLIPRVLRLLMVKVLGVSTVQEIRSAIHRLSTQERALLTAELFALNTEPNADQLEQALSRGLADIDAGRVRPVQEVERMIPRWTSKS